MFLFWLLQLNVYVITVQKVKCFVVAVFMFLCRLLQLNVYVITVQKVKCFVVVVFMFCCSCIYVFILVVTVERLRDHRSESQMFCCSCIHVFILVVTVERLRDHRSESQMFCCSCIYVFILVVTVERLRDHWTETQSQVSQRKEQLEDMLLECRQFEDQQAEFQRWITQVEEDLNRRSADTPHTPDHISRCIKEHKVGWPIILYIMFKTTTSNMVCRCIDHNDLGPIPLIILRFRFRKLKMFLSCLMEIGAC